VTTQSERLATGPLDRRDLERVAELLLRGLARKTERGGAQRAEESLDRGSQNVSAALEDAVLDRLRVQDR
jgi:hypothetical protein